MAVIDYSLRRRIAALEAGGMPVVRKFPFAFDTADLLTGASLYTPTIGDILLDAWVEIDTPWNGTSPFGDAGQFIGGDHFGWWGGSVQIPLQMDVDAADNNSNIHGLLQASGSSQSGASLAIAAAEVGATQALQVSGGLLQLSGLGGGRMYPAKFVTADPVKFCVSQNGTNTGSDPGSTQGAAILYLTTARPV